MQILPPGASEEALAPIQRFRGGIYLSEGAITAKGLTDGRHIHPHDPYAYHIIAVRAGGIAACVGLRIYREREMEGLAAPLSEYIERVPLLFREMARIGLAQVIQDSYRRYPVFGVVYGLAAKHSGPGCLGAVLAREVVRLGTRLGGGMAVAAVTRRNRAGELLRKVAGAKRLPPTFPWYDYQHHCVMEMLVFEAKKGG